MQGLIGWAQSHDNGWHLLPASLFGPSCSLPCQGQELRLLKNRGPPWSGRVWGMMPSRWADQNELRPVDLGR